MTPSKPTGHLLPVEKRKLVAQLLAERSGKPLTYPLSFTQQRLWFLNQLEPDSPAYNMAFALRLDGPLNVDALKKSLNIIMARHQILRTTFTTVNEQAVQVVASKFSLSLREATLSKDDCQRLFQEESRQPFELSQGPLIRTTLIHLEESSDSHIVLVVVHHIIFDGWSKGLFIKELHSLYQAFTAGKASPLPDLPLQYSDYAQQQQQWLAEDAFKSQLAYWKEQLSGAPAMLELPTDRPRPPVQTFRGDTVWFQLNPEVVDALRKISRQAGGTLFMILQAAFATLLYRYSGQEDIVLGSVIANRNRKAFEPLLGFFANTLALRTDLSGRPTFLELLSRVRQTDLEAYTHQELPFEKLVEALQPERSLSHSPLFQVMLVLQNTPGQTVESSELALSPIEIETKTAKFDLALQITGLTGRLEYNTDLFNADTITRLAGHWQTLLAGIAANPQQRITELPLLTNAEQQQLLTAWNSTESDYPQTSCIHHLFEAQVERTPDAPAVVFTNQALTYRELNAQANQVAHYLRQSGVGPEVLVGLCMERSPRMLVGLLGILKAGGAYVPLDPAYPPERLAFMVEDANLSILLTQKTIGADFFNPDVSGPSVQTIYLDADWETITQQPAANLANSATPQNLAYVIYTSGSTGRPKGVMIPHRGLVNYLSWSLTAYNVADGDGAPVQSSIAFDATITSLLSSLLVGKAVTLLPEDNEIEALVETLYGQRQYSLVKITPAHLELLSRLAPAEAALSAASKTEPEAVSVQTKAFVIGGEALLSKNLAFWQEHAPHTRLINEYGPTETVVGCCIYEANTESGSSEIVPIGRPIANTQLYLLDSQLQPVPVGVPGELYIGGHGLARGYLNRPDLTAERFIPNPFSQTPGARLYKTGDLARYRPDGNLEFLGRIDRQVKLRGFRIELGEIEAVLLEYPGIYQAVVTLREDTPDDKRLVAYFVTDEEPAPRFSRLRAFLQNKLPDYMIPAAFVPMDSLRLTPNGKIDHRFLPAPDTRRPDQEKRYAAPRNPLETLLAGMWADVLGLDAVGIYDNFFELGGHSLQTVQFVSKLSTATGQSISIKDIFLHPTVAELARALNNAPSKEQNAPQPAASPDPAPADAAAQLPFLTIERRSLLALFATGKLKPVDSAAIGYLNREQFSRTDAVYDWFDTLPVCVRLTETVLGRTALIQLPYFDTELYANQKALVESVIDALNMAKQIGARSVSLTGLIPSATDYGQAVASAAAEADLPPVTTGHGTTTAAVVLTVKRILADSGRDIRQERVGMLGLGSIGVASLHLLLSSLPHPKALILCDVYSKRDALESIKREIISAYGYQGDVVLAQAQAQTPAEFYESTLMIGATNAPDILDIDRLKPGTIIVDDSAPHCFNINQAIHRFETQQDILFTEGGVLQSPEPMPETRYIPKDVARTPALADLEMALARGYRHNPFAITGCIFSSLLSASSEAFRPTVGLVDLNTCRQHYNKLTELGFQGADLHCRHYTLQPDMIAAFRQHFGSKNG